MKVPDKVAARFPWILWYLWKARNSKAFNGSDTLSLDTFQLACAETDAWTVAQVVDQMGEDNERTANAGIQEEPIDNLPRSPFWRRKMEESFMVQSRNNKFCRLYMHNLQRYYGQ